ncbi:mCG146931 [Mus musculus]|nr:mCG146931 [Mus musculus]
MFLSAVHSNPGPGIFFVASILGFSLGPCFLLFLLLLMMHQCRKKSKCQEEEEDLGNEKLLQEEEKPYVQVAEFRESRISLEEKSMCLY